MVFVMFVFLFYMQWSVNPFSGWVDCGFLGKAFIVDNVTLSRVGSW